MVVQRVRKRVSTVPCAPVRMDEITPRNFMVTMTIINVQFE